MNTMLNQTSHLSRAIATAMLATAIFLLASILWGLLDIYRFELCKPQLLLCDLAREAWIHPLRGAPFVALSLLVSLFGFKSTLSRMNWLRFIAFAFVYSSALVAIYPYIFDLRELVAIYFFPYVTPLRFGDAGFVLIWGSVTLVVSMLVTLLFVRAITVPMHNRDLN